MKNLKELIIEKKEVKSQYKDDFGEKYCIKVSNIPDEYKKYYFLSKDEDYYYYDGDQGSKYVGSAKFYDKKDDAIKAIKHIKEKANFTPTCELLTIKTEVVSAETIE